MMYYEVFNIIAIWFINKIFVIVANTPLLSVAIHIYHQAVKSTTCDYVSDVLLVASGLQK